MQHIGMITNTKVTWIDPSVKISVVLVPLTPESGLLQWADCSSLVILKLFCKTFCTVMAEDHRVVSMNMWILINLLKLQQQQQLFSHQWRVTTTAAQCLHTSEWSWRISILNSVLYTYLTWHRYYKLINTKLPTLGFHQPSISGNYVHTGCFCSAWFVPTFSADARSILSFNVVK